jgi:hypothetical protein
MRANEFVTEAKSKVHPEHASTMPMSVVYPDMDMGYDYYRFMTRVASHPHHSSDHDHDHFRDNPVAAAYTQEEMDMLASAIRGTGYKSKVITDTKGVEPPSTNKASPVPHNSGARKKK